MLVMWIVQIIVGGFNTHLIIPSVCLLLCYVLMKKS